ncbi:MAG TPA: ABC transporter ATP-binding protein [Ktedonobacterales bacterium]
MKALRLCWQYLRRYQGLALLALIAMVMQTAMDLAVPWPLKIIFDNVLGARALPGSLGAVLIDPTTGGPLTRQALLNVMVAIMLVIALIDAIFTYIGGLLTASIGQRVLYELRVQVFDHIQNLSISFHKNSRVGDLSARLTSDIQAIQDLVSSGLNTLITNSLTVVGVLVIVVAVDWRFAVLMIGATPLMFFVAGSYRKRIRKASREQRTMEGQVSATVQERIGAIQVVQAFAHEEQEAKQFAQQSRKSLNAGLAVSRLQSELSPLVDLVGVIGLATVTWLGAQEVISGRITLGYLLLFTTYLRSILSPVRQLAKLSNQFSKADASAERVQEILDIQPDVRDMPGARHAPRLRGAVSFEHVYFGYAKDTLVLRDISVRVQPGMAVALVGQTGSGKSTMIGLIPRFHDPLEGQVLIDGIDIRRFTLRSLRDQVSLVLQEPVLFNATIRDNIAYGREGASDVDVLRAARAANVEEFVSRLPNGYGTVLGERGGTLSGGQRQRIAIARAIVRDAPILLLDEPTSGLDAQSEVTVMEALQRLMQGRTTFVIAHRLSTIERADLILVMQNGKIREGGTHRELLRAGGLYAHLHSLQFKDSVESAPQRAEPTRRQGVDAPLIRRPGQ